MDRFPSDFDDLLVKPARHLRATKLSSSRPFAAIDGAIAPETARAVVGLLERAMAGHLVTMARPIPPETISRQTRDHQERLPKCVRVRTAYLERRDSSAYRAARAIGLIAMLRSDSLRRLAERLAGRTLDPAGGQQVLCYRAGDYSGPHTDHYPENARARGGYVDVHLTFANDGVARQSLVYSRAGHLSEAVEVGRGGLISVYRLPFWHYTTPLIARPGAARRARRWVLLATFLFADHSAAESAGSR